jgi:hypothetical protein
MIRARKEREGCMKVSDMKVEKVKYRGVGIVCGGSVAGVVAGVVLSYM